MQALHGCHWTTYPTGASNGSAAAAVRHDAQPAKAMQHAVRATVAKAAGLEESPALNTQPLLYPLPEFDKGTAGVYVLPPSNAWPRPAARRGAPSHHGNPAGQHQQLLSSDTPAAGQPPGGQTLPLPQQQKQQRTHRRHLLLQQDKQQQRPQQPLHLQQEPHHHSSPPASHLAPDQAAKLLTGRISGATSLATLRMLLFQSSAATSSAAQGPAGTQPEPGQVPAAAARTASSDGQHSGDAAGSAPGGQGTTGTSHNGHPITSMSDLQLSALASRVAQLVQGNNQAPASPQDAEGLHTLLVDALAAALSSASASFTNQQRLTPSTHSVTAIPEAWAHRRSRGQGALLTSQQQGLAAIGHTPGLNGTGSRPGAIPQSLFRPRPAATILWAAARAGAPIPPKVVRALLESVVRGCDQLVSGTSTGRGSSQYSGSSTTTGRPAGNQRGSRRRKATSKASSSGPGGYQAGVEDVQLGPGHLADAVWGAAKLAPQELSHALPHMQRALQICLPGMSSAQVASLVWGLAACQGVGQLEPLVEGLTEELWSRGPSSFGTRDLFTLLQAFVLWETEDQQQQGFSSGRPAQQASRELSGTHQQLQADTRGSQGEDGARVAAGLQRTFAQRLFDSSLLTGKGSKGGLQAGRGSPSEQRSSAAASGAAWLLVACAQGGRRLSRKMLLQLLRLLASGAPSLGLLEVSAGLQALASLTRSTRSISTSRQFSGNSGAGSRHITDRGQSAKMSSQVQVQTSTGGHGRGRDSNTVHVTSAGQESRHSQHLRPTGVELLAARGIASATAGAHPCAAAPPPGIPAYAWQGAVGTLAVRLEHVLLEAEAACTATRSAKQSSIVGTPRSLAISLRALSALDVSLSRAAAAAAVAVMQHHADGAPLTAVQRIDLLKAVQAHGLPAPKPLLQKLICGCDPGGAATGLDVDHTASRSDAGIVSPTESTAEVTIDTPAATVFSGVSATEMPGPVSAEAAAKEVAAAGQLVQLAVQMHVGAPKTWAKEVLQSVRGALSTITATVASPPAVQPQPTHPPSAGGSTSAHLAVTRSLQAAAVSLLWGLPVLGVRLPSQPALQLVALSVGTVPCSQPQALRGGAQQQQAPLPPVQLLRLLQGLSRSRVCPLSSWLPLVTPLIQSHSFLTSLKPLMAARLLTALAAAIRGGSSTRRSTAAGRSNHSTAGLRLVRSSSSVSTTATGTIASLTPFPLRQLGLKRLQRSAPSATRALLLRCTTLSELAGLLSAMLRLGLTPGPRWMATLHYKAAKLLGAPQQDQSIVPRQTSDQGGQHSSVSRSTEQEAGAALIPAAAMEGVAQLTGVLAELRAACLSEARLKARAARVHSPLSTSTAMSAPATPCPPPTGPNTEHPTHGQLAALAGEACAPAEGGAAHLGMSQPALPSSGKPGISMGGTKTEQQATQRLEQRPAQIPSTHAAGSATLNKPQRRNPELPSQPTSNANDMQAAVSSSSSHGGAVLMQPPPGQHIQRALVLRTSRASRWQYRGATPADSAASRAAATATACTRVVKLLAAYAKRVPGVARSAAAGRPGAVGRGDVQGASGPQ